MVDLIPARLILDAMDAVLDVRGQGPALVQGLMVTGALARHVLLSPTGQVVGTVQKVPDPIGQGHDHALLVAIGAVALVGESHLLGNCCRMT